jgi:DNA-binding transcriptional ArsR family regulator
VKLQADTTLIPGDRADRLREAKKAGLPAGAAFTYLELARIANLAGGNRWRSTEQLARTLGDSERTIREHALLLERAGLIEREGGEVACIRTSTSLPPMALTNGTLLPEHRLNERHERAAKRQKRAATRGKEPVQHDAGEPPKEEGTRTTTSLPLMDMDLPARPTLTPGGREEPEPTPSRVLSEPLSQAASSPDPANGVDDVAPAPPQFERTILANRLYRIFTNPQARVDARQHVESYHALKDEWLLLPTEFLRAVLDHAAVEAKWNPWGLIAKSLSNPRSTRSVIPAAYAVMERLDRERATAPDPLGQPISGPGVYRTPDGSTIAVEEVRDGAAFLPDGRVIVLPLTRGWQPVPGVAA